MITLNTESCTPMDAWSTFTAMSLHFNSERDYDAFKFNFKGPRCKRETFMSHKNRYQFEKLARAYPKRNEVILYSLANLIAGNKWIGECNEGAYNNWTGKVQALDYNFKTDVATIGEEAERQSLTFDQCFLPDDLSEPPLIYKLYVGGKISIETLAVFENMLSFTSRLNKKLIDPLEVSKGTSFLVSKYAPFLVHAADLKKYTENVLSVFTK
tara:strand:+ start:11970 stop:12605 length:636 start_codon:yes stop_codon:yes gene_type:complete